MNFLSLILLLLFSFITIEKDKPNPSTRPVEQLGKQDQIKLNLDFLAKPLTEVNIFSKNVLLKAPLRVMQNFDIDSKRNIYYAQLGAVAKNEAGKTKSHELYILKAQANISPKQEVMTLQYFGHGSNIAIEETADGEVYVWVNSIATKNKKTLEYIDSRAVSRIKFEAGKVYDQGHGGASYFLNKGLYNVHPAIDAKRDVLAISATKNGIRYFFFYKLSEARKLPLTQFQIEVLAGGEEKGSEQKTVVRNVDGYDLNQLKPLASFSLPKGTDPENSINSYSFQGFDVAGDYVFFYEGDGNKNDPNNGSSNAYITVLDMNGKIVAKRSKVAAISNMQQLEQAGITKTGYMEAEGIKVVGKQLFIAFASRGIVHGNDDYRRANIFAYDLPRYLK